MEKAAAKISRWYDRHLTKAGGACLTKSVLTSQPVYLLTVIKTAKEFLDDLDKMRKCFLWAGRRLGWALAGMDCTTEGLGGHGKSPVTIQTVSSS